MEEKSSNFTIQFHVEVQECTATRQSYCSQLIQILDTAKEKLVVKKKSLQTNRLYDYIMLLHQAIISCG